MAWLCLTGAATLAQHVLRAMHIHQPLHWLSNLPQVIELLVTHKSPVDATNKAGWTPLHRAVYNNRRDAANVLVKLGANMSLKNKDGNTSLHLACFMGYLDVIEVGPCRQG